MQDLKQLTSEALVELSDGIDNELTLRHGAALDDVDDFIAYGKSLAATGAVHATYARFALLLLRLPAVHRIVFAHFIQKYTLFCTYGGVRHRVTGASRMGDIWLARDFTRESGYDLRVAIADCSQFSPGSIQERVQMIHPIELYGNALIVEIDELKREMRLAGQHADNLRRKLIAREKMGKAFKELK